MTTKASNIFRISCLAALSLSFTLPAAAQTPSQTVTYELVRSLIEPKLNEMIEKDGRLEWGDEPHLTLGPTDEVPGNSSLHLHLNLKGKEQVIVTVSAKIWVDVYIVAGCYENKVSAQLDTVQLDTSLPDWLEHILDIDVPRASLEGFIEMADGLLATQVCGDVKLWPEGVVVFPKDEYDPFAAEGVVGHCKDSTTGRSGQVYIEGNQIHAQIDPGRDPRWPDNGAAIHVWVSQDGTDATGHEIDETRILKGDGSDQFYEKAAGQGIDATFNLPADNFYVGCEVQGYPVF